MSRLELLSPLYRPAAVSPVGADDRRVQVTDQASCVVRPQLLDAASFTALWMHRWCLVLDLVATPEATREDCAATLGAAVAVASAIDRSHGPDETEVGATDRAVSVRVPALDVEAQAGAALAGFTPTAVEGHAPLSRVAGTLSSCAPAGEVPQPRDRDDLAQALGELLVFDAVFLGGFPARADAPRHIQREAEAAVARGYPWTRLVRDGAGLAGVLMVTPPAEAAWTVRDLTVSEAAYVGYAWTRPDQRGRGLMSALLRQVTDDLATQGVTDLTIGWAHANPLGSRYWLSHGFAPTFTTWIRSLT